MKRSTQLLLALAILLVIFAAAFLLLDFRFMQAHMAVDSNAATYAFSVGEETPLPLEQDLDLYVQAPPEIEDELAEALRKELTSNPYVRDINVQAEPVVTAADTVLVVKIEEPSAFFWSPFYTRSAMVAEVAYASDGDVAWIDEEAVVLEAQDPPVPVVRVRAEHTFDGSAYGLISGPGYVHYLAVAVADYVNQSLADTLTSHGGNQ